MLMEVYSELLHHKNGGAVDNNLWKHLLEQLSINQSVGTQLHPGWSDDASLHACRRNGNGSMPGYGT